jgi:hypothetical protein
MLGGHEQRRLPGLVLPGQQRPELLARAAGGARRQTPE